MRKLLQLLTCRLLFLIVLLYFPVRAAMVWLRQWDEPFTLFWWGIASLVLLLLVGASMGYAKHLKKRPMMTGGALWCLLWLALTYDCLGNLWAFACPWQFHLSLFLTLGCICLTWALLKHWSLVFWAPFLLAQLFQFVGYHQYGTRLNSLVVAEMLEASWEDALAYMTPLNLSMLGLGIVFVAGFCILQWLLLRRCSRWELTNTGVLFVALCGVFAATLRPQSQARCYYWPIVEVPTLVEAVQEALYINEATINQVLELPSPTREPSTMNTLKGDEGVVLVVHVGESIRADRMSINGYERDTTPWLRQCPNLINFPTCVSAACDTSQAQIAILTNGRRSIHDPDPMMKATTGSVLDLFSLHGFDLYSFFGRRVAQQLKYDRVVRVLTRRSKDRFNAPQYPWSSIPQMQDVLDANPKRNLLLFINNEGSHTPFCYYDVANPPFTPTVPNFQNPSQQAVEVNNAYDNTIHYTDEFFRRLADSLKGRPFIYLYISDHGEYLGHDDMWGRASLGNHRSKYHSTTGCLVGMFCFYSPEMEKLHPHFAQALRQMRENSKMTVGHEHAFHTLLGLFGIRTPHYIPTLDLTNDAAQPYSGPMPAQP